MTHPDVIYRGERWRVQPRSATLFLLEPRHGNGIAWLTATELAELPFSTRGKPLGKHGQLTDERLQELHLEHLAGKSIRQLGREVWRQAGYASDHSASMGISEGFKRLGLERRLRSVAIAAANRKRRDPANGRNMTEYKRIKRKEAGGYRPCRGVKRNPPGKGRPCSRFAMAGSDFCRQHDPRFEQRDREHLAGARAKIGVAA